MFLFFIAFTSIIIVPILVIIFGFVCAGILFIIWNIMGSKEDFETAYRCTAYASAITPITAILNFIPFIGVLLSLAWGLCLLVFASIEVHKIAAKTAWIVFGIIFGILALISVSSQIATRRLTRSFSKIEKQLKNMDEMSPEEAGKAFGQFMKGMQQGTETTSEQQE